MEAHAKETPADETHRLHDSGKRNRIETRDASVWKLKPKKDKSHWADAFKTLITIHRQTDVFNTRKKDWVSREEIAYYLCDLELSAEQANIIIRNHWGVENRIHHVRDTRLKEDESRIRTNPSIFALLRSYALNIFRFNNIKNISQALYENALNLDNILLYQGI
jgi:predicted transposase YbfD/YdcC